MFRGVFSGALRDSSASTAAAAKCSLIVSGLVRSSSSWTLSLANVKQPSTETLHACGVSILKFSCVHVKLFVMFSTLTHTNNLVAGSFGH